KLEVPRPAFADPPRGADARGVHWVRPELVAEVEFGEMTRDHILRHTAFKGLREDKPAREAVREQPAHVAEDGSARRNPAASAPTEMPSAEAPPATVPSNEEASQAPKKSSGRIGHVAEIAGVRITNAHRAVYPDVGITKYDVAAFYESIADFVLPHIAGR